MLDSIIRNIGKEFDYEWYSMAEEIIGAREKIEDLEKELEDLKKELDK